MVMEDSQRTFLHAPDVMETTALDPVGIAGAKKCIDFDFLEEGKLMSDEGIRVYARVKPVPRSEEAKDAPRLMIGEKDITTGNVEGSLSQRFSFTRIFDASVGQKDFFSLMVQPRVREFLMGYHQLIFTYGTSSSGKTFTVQGTPSQPGILPRALDIIFNSLGDSRILDKSPFIPLGFDALSKVVDPQGMREEKEAVLALGSYLKQEVGEDNASSSSCSSLPEGTSRLREESRIEDMDSEGMFNSLWVSFAEIYNENIHDLFEKISLPKKLRTASRKTPLKLCEDRKGTAYIKGLREICVSSPDEAYQLLLIGRKNLQFAATKLNHNSSRSHCIFTIKLIRFCDAKDPQFGRVHILSFCDLAGSERMNKTNNVGVRRLEAGNINASLLVLSRVMKTLRDNQRLKDAKKAAVVPFRDSKLTRLFQAFFTGYGKASMIVNVTPSPYLFDETLHALKFAAITSKVNYAKEQPAKPRKSRFSSILSQHKRTSALTGRNTILWENPKARSTLCPSQEEEENEEAESSSDSEEEGNNDDTHYEALTNLIGDLERRLAEEKRRNTSLESDIRTELCKEFNVLMVKVENEWQQRLKDTTERMDELNDWRIQKLESAYNVSRKRKRQHDANSSSCEDDRVLQLESDLEERTSELEDNRKQLQAIKDTHKSLLDSRNRLQEELTSLRFTSEDQKSKILSLEDEMRQLSLESKSKDDAIESLGSNPIIKDLKNQLWDLKTKHSEKAEEVTYLTKLLDEAGEEFLVKDDNEAKLNAEILSLKTELASTKMALNDATEENSVLLKDSAVRQEDLESIEELLAVSRSENVKLQEENKRLAERRNSDEETEDQGEMEKLRQRLDSTSEEVDGLLQELNRSRKDNEEQEKALRKAEEERNRLEKDLNDEIETLRASKVKLKSAEEGKRQRLTERDAEIKSLEKEVKNLNKDTRTVKEALKDTEMELERLRSQTDERGTLIEKLEAQVKSLQQEEDVIHILRSELKQKNSDYNQLMERVSELEASAGRLSQLSQTQETVSYLESQIEAKNYEIKKTSEEKESVHVRYGKLLKSKEEELSREKQEALRLREVMRVATPNSKNKGSLLEEEIHKKDEVIRGLESRLKRSLSEGEVEDALRDEVESLKRSLFSSNEAHRKDLAKIRSANEKVINEYKEANRELQKQVGIPSSSSGGDSPENQEEEEEGPSVVESSAVVSMEAQSVKRRQRRGRAATTTTREQESSNLENSDCVFEDSAVRKSTRVTRSRPVHKTKKKHVSYVERNRRLSEEGKPLQDDNTSVSVETPRRSKRNTPSSSNHAVEALSPLENLNGSWESSRSPGKRQLRTRRKKH